MFTGIEQIKNAASMAERIVSTKRRLLPSFIFVNSSFKICLSFSYLKQQNGQTTETKVLSCAERMIQLCELVVEQRT
jgi:hypothetical protein